MVRLIEHRSGSNRFCFRFVQNLVFYGVSQSTDTWGFDPYRKWLMSILFIGIHSNWCSVSFTISAVVEILSCLAIHPVLNRVGRKPPYFIAALGFSLIALTAILTPYLTLKNSQSKSIESEWSLMSLFEVKKCSHLFWMFYWNFSLRAVII